MLAIARLAQKYAIRVHYDPLAGRGTTHKRPKGSLRGLILRSNNSVARLSSRLREKIYTAAARIDLHHSKGFMGLGQNRHPTRLNLGDALAKSGRSARLRHRAGCPNAEAGGVVCTHADNASGFCFCQAGSWNPFRPGLASQSLRLGLRQELRFPFQEILFLFSLAREPLGLDLAHQTRALHLIAVEGRDFITDDDYFAPSVGLQT